MKLTSLLLIVALLLGGSANANSQDTDETPPAANPVEASIHVVLDHDSYTFNLAEVGAGVTFSYKIVVDTDVPGVIPSNFDDVSQPESSSDLLSFPVIDGNGHSYAIRDTGARPGPAWSARTVPAGEYAHTFKWTGRNWNGPSDTSNPLGDAFPAGEYMIKVYLRGTVEVDGKPVEYSLVGGATVTLTPQLPSVADYGLLLTEHHFLSLEDPRPLPKQPEALPIVEKNLGTLNDIDYVEMRAVPTDPQWFVTLFAWSGAVYNGHPNVFQWPSAICVITVDKTKYMVGVRYHKITVKLDLKFHTKINPQDVTVELTGNNVKVQVKDWAPENPKYWVPSTDRSILVTHDGEISAHLTKRLIFIQTTGNRLDCRMAVIMTKRDDQGKLMVAGGIFTITIENGQYAFPE